MENKSLGLIETWGHVPAVEAADAGCKAANVSLVGYEEVRAGRVAILLAGDVAAVKTAVTAGAAAARKVGKVITTHVIARPDRQLRDITIPPVPAAPEREFKPPGAPPSPPARTASGAAPEAATAGDQTAAGPVESSLDSEEKARKSPPVKGESGKSSKTGRKKKI